MAIEKLPINYVTEKIDASVSDKRKYQIINNSDGTISLEDATTYTQKGSNFDADDINKINQTINQVIDQLEEAGTGSEAGSDGFPPTATVSKTGNAATITITDINGTTTATVTDGADGYTPQKGIDYFDGENGEDGFSPTIEEDAGNNSATYKLNITTKDGTITTPNLMGPSGDGSSEGTPGGSVTASVTKTGSTATITITDNNGTTEAVISDGENGLSAYEIAVKNDFAGTESEWLESLKGQDGTSGVTTEQVEGLIDESFLENMCGVKIAQDTEGNWGYIAPGADTVTPFNGTAAIISGIHLAGISAVLTEVNYDTLEGCEQVTGE